MKKLGRNKKEECKYGCDMILFPLKLWSCNMYFNLLWMLLGLISLSSPKKTFIIYLSFKAVLSLLNRSFNLYFFPFCSKCYGIIGETFFFFVRSNMTSTHACYLLRVYFHPNLSQWDLNNFLPYCFTSVRCSWCPISRPGTNSQQARFCRRKGTRASKISFSF